MSTAEDNDDMLLNALGTLFWGCSYMWDWVFFGRIIKKFNHIIVALSMTTFQLGKLKNDKHYPSAIVFILGTEASQNPKGSKKQF